MRDQLIGYLLDALEPAEREAVEERLEVDAQLREELDVLHRSLEPLRADKGTHAPPPGLAEKTCELVAIKSAVQLAPLAPAPSRRRWTMADMVVAAGIMLAASLLLFPAVSHSRFNSQLAACQNNLRQVGLALSQYSQAHNGMFPAIQPNTNLGYAGVYASILNDQGFLENPHVVSCPSSPAAANADQFRVPTIGALKRARGPALAEMQRAGGGSYGYNMGYRNDGRYLAPRNQGRSKYAILSDTPSSSRPHFQSDNHGGYGQNVYFEDGHVRHMTGPTPVDGLDDFFVNDQGQIEAGMHENDAVIGSSSAVPLVPVIRGQ